MTVKFLATGTAAVAAIAAAAAGVTSIAATGPTAFQVQPVALGTPLPSPASGRYPQDPPPPPPPPGQNLPSAEQLSTLCNSVTNPGVSYTTKDNLVQGGISPDEGHAADHDLRKAYRDGKFPLSFNVSNIQPAGPNAATADVAISGPKLAAPVTQNYTFVDQGGSWMMSHDSAIALVQAATA